MEPVTLENAALVRGFLTDVVAGGDVAAADVFLAEDVVTRYPGFEDGGDRGAISELSWRVLAGADVDIDVTDVVATADRVAVRGRVTGTHRESLMDLAPTGTAFEIAAAWFCRIDDGRIAEIWSLPDGLGLMRQLGAIPRRDQHQSMSESTERYSP